jgi:RNA polymerase sigma-70 factor (ECF subfamily)
MHLVGKYDRGERDSEKLKDFELLFFKFHGRLVIFSQKFTGNLLASQDIVQDAFIALWEKQDSFEILESPKAYLFQIVRNRSLNCIRDTNIHNAVEQELSLKFDTAEKNLYSNPNDPFISLLELELQDKIDKTISSLPDKCRQVYKLSRYKGFKNSEIAEMLGISMKMVEKHISRALRILRTELSEYL